MNRSRQLIRRDIAETSLKLLGSTAEERLNRRSELLSCLDSLHRRMLSGDSVARTELCDVLFREVRRRMRQQFPNNDHHTIDTATEDAILAYLRQPTAYDSNRSSLTSWVVQIAVNRLRTVQRSGRRRFAHEYAAGLDMARFPAHEDRPVAEEKECWIKVHEAILFGAAKTAEERALITAKLTGAGLEAEVIALRIHTLATDEARRRINRVWENLSRRARRFRSKTQADQRRKPSLAVSEISVGRRIRGTQTNG